MLITYAGFVTPQVDNIKFLLKALGSFSMD